MRILLFIAIFVMGVVADSNITVTQKDLDSSGWGRYVEKSGKNLYFVGDAQYSVDSSTQYTSSLKIIKTDLNQNIVWDRNYSSMEPDFNSIDIVNKIKDTGKGLVVIGNYQPNYVVADNFGFIRVFDYNGNEIKNLRIFKMYKNGNFDNIFIYDIDKTSTGYMAVGSLNDGSLILKLDNDFNELNRAKYIPSEYSSDNDFLDCISRKIITLNDGYILGTTIQFNSSSNRTSIAMVEKFDSNGTLVWSKKFKDTNNSYDKSLKNLIYANGRIYAVIDNYYFMDFIAIDAVSGSILQQQTYPGVHNALYLDNEGFLLYSKDKIIKIDFSFNIFFEDSLDNADYAIYNMQYIAPNKFVTVGYTPYPQKIDSIEYSLNAPILEAGAVITKKYIDSLSSGWHLIGTNLKITDLSIFDNCYYVWQFKNGRWLSFSNLFSKKLIDLGFEKLSTLDMGDGFWVYKIR